MQYIRWSDTMAGVHERTLRLIIFQELLHEKHLGPTQVLTLGHDMASKMRPYPGMTPYSVTVTKMIVYQQRVMFGSHETYTGKKKNNSKNNAHFLPQHTRYL